MKLLLATTAMLTQVVCCLARADDPGPILQQMAREQANFDTHALHQRGVAGLAEVLDFLLPDTAASKQSPELVAGLITKLGADSFLVREQAQRELVQLGSSARNAVSKAGQVSPDPEIRFRAKAVLAQWAVIHHRPVKQYLYAFGKYLAEVHDKERLALAARRGRVALDAGMPQGDRKAMIQMCIVAGALADDDEINNELAPLLENDERQVAVWFTRSLGAARDNRQYPRLLLAALKSDSPDVVQEAIDRTPNCWDFQRRPAVRDALMKIFAGDDTDLKLQVCFPLMHDHREQLAIDHLLELASHGDRKSQGRAVSWLGDSCNSGKPAPPKLLQVFAPLFKSTDDGLRRGAYGSIGTYAGEAVIRHLIEGLGEPQASIVRSATLDLAHRKEQERDLTLRLLTEAAENHASEQVRNNSRSLLKELNQKWK